MTVNVFSVPVFFVVFRETLETVIIVSVLLAFLKQTLDGPNADRRVYKKLVRQVNAPRYLRKGFRNALRITPLPISSTVLTALRSGTEPPSASSSASPSAAP
jgi:high-affinity Fe2+/Pb2+ permease